MKIYISMQTMQFLVLATVIAALIAGVNVAQVAHAAGKGTCVVNSDTTVANNVNNGNPHCFDPEQQPAGTPNPNPGTGGSMPPCSSVPTGPGCSGCAGPTGSCPGESSSHPQSLNPQDKVVGDPHEDPKPGILPNNPQGQSVGNPHVFCR